MSDFRREIDFRTGVLRREFTWHTARRRASRASCRSGSSASSTAISPCCDCRSRCSTRRPPVTITSLLVNRQDVGVAAAGSDRSRSPPRAHVRPPRARTGAADTRRRLAGGGTSRSASAASAAACAIAAASRHAVEAAATATFDTELDARHARPRRSRLEAAAGDTVMFTKYVAYHSAGQIGEASDRRRSTSSPPGCRGTLDAAERPAGSGARRPAGAGSTGSGRAPTSPSRATTQRSRRSAGTCSRWRRRRPTSASAASPPRR